MSSEYRWYNKYSEKFLKDGYLLDGQTVDERVTIIAERAEEILDIVNFAEKFKRYFKKGWFSLSTPVWSNFGTKRGLPISCFGSYLEDSMESILHTNAEVGMMTKIGGGTSAYFGNLRSRGSSITDNGKSSGAVHFMQLFDKQMQVISQGNCYKEGTKVLTKDGYKDFRDVSETDLLAQVDDENKISYTNTFELTVNDFVGDLKRFKGDIEEFDFSVTPNHRMVLYKEKKSRFVLEFIQAEEVDGIKNKEDYYFCDMSGYCYRDGIKTIIPLFTNLSEISIEDEPYSGKVYCAIVPKGRLIVKDKGDSSVVCGNTRRGSFAAYLPIDHPDIAEFLKIKSEGDPIQDISFGVCVSDNFMEEMISGDKDKRKIWAKVLETRANVGYPYIFFSGNVNKNKPQVYKDKGLEIYNSNLCVIGSTEITIKISEELPEQIISIKEFVETWDRNDYKKFPLVKTKHGFHPVTRAFKTGVSDTIVEIEVSNGVRSISVKCTPDHEIFTDRGWVKSSEITLEDKVIVNDNWQIIQGKHFHFHEDPVEVFDITVPETRSFYANGILISNCSEIALHTNENESFVCDLSSMNLLYYDEWKDTDAVETLFFLLDAVMTEFIEKASGIKFMERAVNFAKNQRAIGLGVLGYHSYLQSKMIPFESMEAKFFNSEVFRHLDKETLKASKKLATIFGEPDLLKGYGERNVTRLAIAPTKSSAFILGQVSEGIEPIKSNYYVKDLAKGKFTFKNPYLKELLKSKEKDIPEVWESILKKGGSVQHLDFLTEEEKDVFKTFQEISPKEIVIQASQRQQYIDQSQSLNLMIHPKIPTKDVNKLLIEAWELGVKTLYYQFSVNAAAEFSRNILECKSCEG